MSVLMNLVNEGGNLPWSIVGYPKTLTKDNRASFDHTMNERYKKAVQVLVNIKCNEGKEISEHVKTLLTKDTLVE
jgi:hypothetical protein